MNSTRSRHLTADQIDQIIDLYYEQGVSQYELAEMFNVDQSHISRLVNGISCGLHCMLAKKALFLKKNIVPSKDEALQARSLRAKRHLLHNTKLTWNQVVRIRDLYFSGKMTEMELARKFHVNQSTISKLMSGQKWKEIRSGSFYGSR